MRFPFGPVASRLYRAQAVMVSSIMKSEHRHELQTNDLSRAMSNVTPFLEEYGNRILLGIVAVCLIAGAAIWWARTSTASAAMGWTELVAAQTAEDFGNVADAYAGTEVGTWARLQEAETYLFQGIRLSFTDRAAAVSDLKKAQEGFEQLLDAKGVPAEVRERTLIGMARTLETRSGQDTQPAIAAYEQLIEEFPESVYRTEAEERISALKTGSTQEFYAWFQKQNPRPEDRETPRDGMPMGDLPPGHPTVDPLSLPEIPDRLIPEDAAGIPTGSADGSDPASEKNTGTAPTTPAPEQPTPAETNASESEAEPPTAEGALPQEANPAEPSKTSPPPETTDNSEAPGTSKPQ